MIDSALVESKLIKYENRKVSQSLGKGDGLPPHANEDADSISIFQTRASLYASKYGGVSNLMHISTQVKWYMDTIKSLHINPNEPVSTIEKRVERPLKSLEYKYRKHEKLARILYFIAGGIGQCKTETNP